jgi:hypothetical protein
MKRSYAAILPLAVVAGLAAKFFWIPNEWPVVGQFFACMAPSLAVVLAAFFDQEKPRANR